MGVPAGPGRGRRGSGESILDYALMSAPLFPQTSSQVMWAISSAISVAFFALSGIGAQLLNALGLDGEWRRTSSIGYCLACHFLFVGVYLFRV